MTTRINLAQKLSQFTDHWHPRIIADVNDHQVKLAKVQGEFVWHRHADGDVISDRTREVQERI